MSKYLKKLFGEKLFDLPIMDVGDKNGSTDYIDYIKPTDLSYPIMIGYDKFNRFFIALRYIQNENIRVVSFFQRYSDNKTYFAQGGKLFKKFDIIGININSENLNEYQKSLITIFKKSINGEKKINYENENITII